MECFRTWIKRYQGNSKMIRDLAGDIKEDGRNFPRSFDPTVIRDYLTSHNACKGAMEAFERAYRIYKKETGEWFHHDIGSIKKELESGLD
jgi:hypothetical protein